MLGVALFTAVVSYGSARGLLVLWDETFGKMLRGIAGFMNWTFTVFGKRFGHDFGGAFRAADKAMVNWLEAWARGAEIEIAWTVKAMSAVWFAGVYASEWLARETAQTLDWLIHVRLSRRALAALATAGLSLLLPKILRYVLAHVRPLVVKPVKVIERTLPTHIVRTIVKAVGVAVPSPWAFPRFRRAWREIEEWRRVTAWRLRRLEALLAASGLALAVARMTGTTLKCWRPGGNIYRGLRHLCGLDKWLVDFLLLGAVEAFVVSDLCEFSDLLIREAETLRPVLLELVDVEDALIGCHGAEKPLVLQLPSADLPPLQGVSPLAA